MRGIGLVMCVGGAVACANGSTFSTLNRLAGGSSQDADRPNDDGDGSTGADQSAAPTGGTGESEGTDVPAWVNGAYLTCDWRSVVTESQVEIQCAGRAATSAQPVIAPADGAWSATVASDEIATATTASGEELVAVFILPAPLTPDVAIAVTIGQESLRAPVVALLPGFGHPADLAACLRAGGALTPCLQSVGIYLGAAVPLPTPTPAPAPGAPPPHTTFNSVSYYLGPAGQSCDEVCSPLGGVHPATISVVGSQGSAINCVDVLSQFGTISVYDGQTAPEGIGCHMGLDDSGIRVTNPVTTQGAKALDARRICACQI